MRESKRRKLEAKGWAVGTPTEFLDLTPADEAYLELRLRLADGLRARRQKKHLTQSAFANAIRSSQSRVAKMELGDPTVSLDLLITSLLALGATRTELAALISGRRRRSAA
jgi:hypothetical protein